MYEVADVSGTARTSSDEAVRHIGTNAIPYLLKWISEEPSGEKTIKAINIPIEWLNKKLAPKHDWTIQDKSWIRPSGASKALAALGNQAQAAVPELERLLYEAKGKTAQIIAPIALGNLGQLGILPLTKALTNCNTKVRIAAAAGIYHLGTNAEPLIPILIHSLDDEIIQVKETAHLILMTLKLRPDIVVPAMIARVESENATTRIQAAEILSSYRTLASPAIPALVRALDKTNNSTNVAKRNAILEAIRRIDPQSYTNALERRPNIPPPTVEPQTR